MHDFSIDENRDWLNDLLVHMPVYFGALPVKSKV